MQSNACSKYSESAVISVSLECQRETNAIQYGYELGGGGLLGVAPGTSAVGGGTVGSSPALSSASIRSRARTTFD